MKDATRLSAKLLLSCLVLLSGLGVAVAQDASGGSILPPKVLIIQREMLKPGRGGATHVKTESAFVQAMSAAKWPTRYFAADSMSGLSRSLFFIGYPSFAAWEKDNQAMEKNATLSAALDHASLADGEQLTEYHSGVFAFREDGSLRVEGSIAHMRYFEITQFHVRPGHQKEWDDLVKMYKAGYGKAVPDAGWAMYESIYGNENGGLYIVIHAMKSLAEVDQSFADDKKFEASMGADGMKKLSELSASCIASVQTNLFQFNPKMSYPDEDFIKEDPAFWKPKMAASMKKTATTP